MMPGDPRVQRLIEEILDTGGTAEEACRSTPEILPEVLEGLRRIREIQDQVGDLFPEPTTDEKDAPELEANGLPRVPGYEITEVLGRGGVGVVYKARHLRLNRTVALKMLLSGAFATQAERRRFSRESEVVAGLQHPNIVQVYDVGDLGGRPYFTMEFVEQGGLDRALAGTPRSAREAATLVATLAGAIHAAHLGGIVHRDLKPSNVLLTADGTPKIGDFGLARSLDLGPALTQSGAAVGTPSYMAPEQAQGKSRETGPAADLYALGAVLYEVLTGRPPFRAETAAETLNQVIARDPVPPSRLNAKVPRDLETICLKCLRKDPMLRYADADALASDLRRFLRGDSIAARPESRLQRISRRVRLRPALSAALAVVTLLALALVGGGLWLASERAAAARGVKAERETMAREADADLREMARWLESSSWPEARAAMERATGRIGGRGPADLRERLDRGARELGLVARLDEIRLGGAGSVGGVLSLTQSAGRYEAAFREAGIGRTNEAPEVVAARIRATNIRRALVDALDDWTARAEGSGKDWPLAVARLADPAASGWREQIRNPAAWASREALAGLVANVPFADTSVGLLLTLENHLNAADVDQVPFLVRVQQAHPADFWVNLRLGDVLQSRKRYAEAVRYYQAARAIRPEAGIVCNNLGLTLAKLGKVDEAAEQLRHAVRIDPTAAVSHQNLALTLPGVARPDEVIDQARLALRFLPDAANVHCVLADALMAQGKLDEAVEVYRRSVTLDPKFTDAQERLRTCLRRQGRFEEMRAAWAKAIEADPLEHAARDGYAEFCLFLGDEDEYRRASRAMIARYGARTEPPLCERTGRACLLLPGPEDEIREAAALIDRALAAPKNSYPAWSYPYYLFAKGLAEYRLGRMDEAIAVMEGEASTALGPAPPLVLAMAQHRKGREIESLKTLARAVYVFDWTPARAEIREAWIYHALRREAEAMILPDLAAFLRGEYSPSSYDERIAYLGICQDRGLHGKLARLFEEMFEADPRVAADLSSLIRLRAASAATLAGCAPGPAGEPERARWRAQAREWLKADLQALADFTTTDDRKVLERLRRELVIRTEAPDLAGLRDPSALEKLPPDERRECRAIWDEFDAVLGQIKDAIGPRSGPP